MNYVKLLWNLYSLKNNTKRTKKEISNLQKKKLYQLLHYAYDHSVYYRKVFTEVGISKETIDMTPISSFPTIDKTILLDNFDELVTVSDVVQKELQAFDEQEDMGKLFLNSYHVVHSSGSSGKPGYFIYDESAWNQMLLAVIRGALWDMSMKSILSLLWFTPRILYIAATDGRYGGAMAVASGIEGVKAKQLSLDIKQPLFEWIDQIQEFNPNIIIGYSSAIKILAELVEEGKVNVNIQRIISCGEPLNTNLRAYLEQTFCCDVVNFYGASESLALGVEIKAMEGMYLFDDMNYIEVENGRMYMTSLYNYVQPLIRYELTDRLEWCQNDERYPFNKIKNLTGRNEDLMWFEDALGSREFIHPLAIEGFCIEGMLDYQFIQIDNASFELNIETLKDANISSISKKMALSLQNILNEKQLNYVRFSIKFIDEILPNKQTGKKQLIIQQKGMSE